MKEDSDSVMFEFSDEYSLDPLLRFYFEENIALTYIQGQALVNEFPVLKKVTLSYAAPAYEHRYHDLFKCPVDFGSAQTTIVIDRGWLEKQLQTKDEEFNKICIQHCEDVFRRIKHNEPASALLHGLFMTSRGVLPTLGQAARMLNMSERTLSRRLQQENTNYRNVADGFRAARAREYVRVGSLSQKEMAFMLGFSGPSALHYAFKAWTGQTLREYRDQVRQEYESVLQRH